MATRTSTSAGYVYVVRPRGLVDGHEVVKIGMTTRTVAARVRELQTGSAVAIELLHSIHVDDARWFEKQLHARYHAQRIVGGGTEFFRVSPREVIDEIERIATAISSQRATAALEYELKAYRKIAGIEMFEAHLRWVWFAVWIFASFVFTSAVIHHSPTFRFPNAFAVFIVFAQTGAIVASVIVPLAVYVSSRIVANRFGAVISAKRQELLIKYPLAA